MLDRRKTILYHALFTLAVVSVVGGAGVLMVTTEHVSGSRVFWPLIIVIAALIYSYFAVISRWGMRSLFLGLFISSSAMIRFVAAVFHGRMVVYWPLFAIAAGICTLLAGFIRYRRVRPSFIVPSASFVLLGTFFSIFSFGFSAMRFKTFLSRWWPALFIAAGLVLLIMWIVQRIVLGPSLVKPRGEEAEHKGVQGDQIDQDGP